MDRYDDPYGQFVRALRADNIQSLRDPVQACGLGFSQDVRSAFGRGLRPSTDTQR